MMNRMLGRLEPGFSAAGRQVEPDSARIPDEATNRRKKLLDVIGILKA